MMARDAPRVSVIVPAFQSGATLEGCLRALEGQTYDSFEIVVVDSSPDDPPGHSAPMSLPHVRYERSSQRLLPHAARNRGASLARGSLLAFTDPDIYAEPDWLERMVEAHERTGQVISGAIACHGHRWVDVGMHLSKFDQWLPGGPPRPVAIGPTANLLCPAHLFESMGGLAEAGMLSDAVFSWDLAQAGHTVWFEPSAVVHHHHVGGWADLLRELFRRGREFGHLRLDREDWRGPRVVLHLLATILPLRLVKLVGRIVGNAARARLLADGLWTLPIVVSGQAAWLAGEAAASLQFLTRAR